jgi:hypothetical protein
MLASEVPTKPFVNAIYDFAKPSINGRREGR